MLIKRVFNKESSYQISLKLDEKFSRGISYSNQIVFFQFLHSTCFFSAICPLQVPGFNERFLTWSTRLIEALGRKLFIYFRVSLFAPPFYKPDLFQYHMSKKARCLTKQMTTFSVIVKIVSGSEHLFINLDFYILVAQIL